jgi:hypothetical protein
MNPSTMNWKPRARHYYHGVGAALYVGFTLLF